MTVNNANSLQYRTSIHLLTEKKKKERLRIHLVLKNHKRQYNTMKNTFIV